MSWTLYWVLLAIGIVMTGIFLFLRVKKGGISALYAKAAASLCFISTAFAATSANRDNIQFGLWVAFGLILGMVGDILTEKLMKNHFGKFKFIVFLYTFFLALTMVSAIIAAIATGFEKVWVVMAVGGVLFTLSDAVLSGMYFAENKNTKFNIFLNHILYYAAQFTMAATILCIK